MKTRGNLINGQKNAAATATLFEYPPEATNKDSSGHVIIYTKHDHCQLQPPRFLNDTIISFFMQYHLDFRVKPELKDRIHIFNSFFFAKIKSIRQMRNGTSTPYKCASRWLRNVRIFDKDFLIMPICERDHWLLVIVCYPARTPSVDKHSIDDDDLHEPAVIVLNSCAGLAPSVKKALSQFMRYQWLQERGSERPFTINSKNGVKLLFPDLPQQKNSYDCGVYILGFFYSFLNDPRGSYIRMFRKRNLKSWFHENSIDISRERRKMISLIKRQIENWASTHKSVTNGKQAHGLDSQEIHISSPSQSESSDDHQVCKETDLNGNDYSVIVIN